jgi:hypothetical protein
VRGLLLLITFAAMLALVIAGDLARDAAKVDSITEERVCTEEDFPSDAFNSDAFNYPDATPQGCELPSWARRRPSPPD